MRSSDNDRSTARNEAVTLFSPVEYVEKILVIPLSLASAIDSASESACNQESESGFKNITIELLVEEYKSPQRTVPVYHDYLRYQFPDSFPEDFVKKINQYKLKISALEAEDAEQVRKQFVDLQKQSTVASLG